MRPAKGHDRRMCEISTPLATQQTLGERVWIPRQGHSIHGIGISVLSQEAQ